MQSTKSDAKCTSEGQAIAYNNMTCIQLHDLFKPMLGPNGSLKCLVDAANVLNLTKDGITICKEVPFTHPTTTIITNAAKGLYEITGDGITSFILLTTDIFKMSYKYHNEELVPISSIINSLQLGLNDISIFLKDNLIEINESRIRKLIRSTIETKIKKPEHFVDIIYKASQSLMKAGESNSKMNGSIDTADKNMIEIIKMEGGDPSESRFVNGLILDHGGRHFDMPSNTILRNVCILVTNISLEYEQPEIAGKYKFSSTEQKMKLCKTENEFIIQKTEKIIRLVKEIRMNNPSKSFLIVNERGIDLRSLNLFAKHNILALRRAKRINSERLTRMCGGSILNNIEDLTPEVLGYCGKVTTLAIDDDSYTIVEEVPFFTPNTSQIACSILLRGNSDFKNIQMTIKSALKSIKLANKSKCLIKGGKLLYHNLILNLKEKMANLHEADQVGYKILIEVYQNLIKTLVKNGGGLPYLLNNQLYDEENNKKEVIENLSIVGNVLSNSIYTAISLLMCDDIVVSGKPLREKQ